MDKNKFKAMLVSEVEDQGFKREIITKEIDDLPDGDILVNVKYSSLNFKDTLSAIGNRGVTRNYPHTPGIDGGGLVVESSHEEFKAGDKVIVSGFDVGMNTSGGFQEYIRIPQKSVIHLPEGLSLKESMMYGTAGFTAALSVYKLIDSGLKPEDGEILVTGSTGGVGTIAISILSKLGYSVVAATGKDSEKEMLISLGAKSIISREEANDESNRPLLSSRWAGVVDTVGGNILDTAIKSTNYGGSVTCCGNALSNDLATSVLPFILRGVTLFGIDSVQLPRELRIEIWKKLASDWKNKKAFENIKEVSLENLGEEIDSILAGTHTGRTIINLEL